jgi:eukaryotic-like serine/threonine-protein kinase
MSNQSDNWFNKFFKKASQPPEKQDQGSAQKPFRQPDLQPGVHYKKGNFIGQVYEVYGLLGKGGFGVVYLVYSHEHQKFYALKTFRDEYLQNAAIRQRFHQEANVWINLGSHPFLVCAHYVDGAVDAANNRLYIAMEYIAPGKNGLNTLEQYMRHSPPDLALSLRWAIQICHGMEYAYSKGVRAHCDLKPANILIDSNMTVKITDFGLANVLGAVGTNSRIKLGFEGGAISLSCQNTEGVGYGTPTHMPPEQFTSAAGCDERSDIYAFGVVLYQMLAGGKLPFLASLPRNDTEEESERFWRSMYALHKNSPVPGLDTPIFPLILRCLEKEPTRRYSSFRQLRADLEALHKRLNGESIQPPQLNDPACQEWYNKGFSFDKLGRTEDALRCYDKCLELNPQYTDAWHGKGLDLFVLGQYEEAIVCYDKTLELDPHKADAWNQKGVSLGCLGKFEEAIHCFDKALELNPDYTRARSSRKAAQERLLQKRNSDRG